MSLTSLDIEKATIEVLKKIPNDKMNTLASLQDIQQELGYIPKESFPVVSDYLNVPVAELYAIATFYKALSLEKKGQYVIAVCDGTACHIRGSQKIIDGVKARLNISPGETTPDGKFTLETVNCLGSCALAPIMVVGERYYGKVSLEKLDEILSELGGDIQ